MVQREAETWDSFPIGTCVGIFRLPGSCSGDVKEPIKINWKSTPSTSLSLPFKLQMVLPFESPCFIFALLARRQLAERRGGKERYFIPSTKLLQDGEKSAIIARCQNALQDTCVGAPDVTPGNMELWLPLKNPQKEPTNYLINISALSSLR